MMNEINWLDQENWDMVICSVIPSTELMALLRIFGKGENSKPDFIEKGLRYWKLSIYNEITDRNLTALVTAFGFQGNYISSSLVSRLLDRTEPDAAFLCGIAAGYKGKLGLGDVVISSNVIGYEPTRLQTPTLKRPDYQSSTFEMKQNLLYFDSDQTHFQEYFRNSQRRLAPNQKPSKENYGEDFKPIIHKGDFIASGEKLIADGSIPKLSEEIHEKIRAAEMEAIGFATACNNRVPQVPFAIFRGISDFGDILKTDRWQPTASNSAAAALRAFLESCYVPPKRNDGEEKTQKTKNVDWMPVPLTISFSRAEIHGVNAMISENGNPSLIHIYLNPFISNKSSLPIQITFVEVTYEGTKATPVGILRIKDTILKPNETLHPTLEWILHSKDIAKKIEFQNAPRRIKMQLLDNLNNRYELSIVLGNHGLITYEHKK